MPLKLVNSETISIKKIQADEQKVKITHKSDFISYTEFLKYFSNLNKISKHNLIIGINFTYAWMPTIFDFRSDKLDEATVLLNKVKSNLLTVPELELLKGCFNNSLVGVSKLLHFICPTKYAIWDSRVYRYLTNTEAHDYRINNCNSFLEYLKLCNRLTSIQEYEAIHQSMEVKVGYSMTKYRTLALIMYFNGAKPKTLKS